MYNLSNPGISHAKSRPQSTNPPPRLRNVHGHLATRRAAFERPQPQPRPQQLSPSSPSSPSMTHTHKSSKSAIGRRFPLPQNSSLPTSLPSTPIRNTCCIPHRSNNIQLDPYSFNCTHSKLSGRESFRKPHHR